MLQEFLRIDLRRIGQMRRPIGQHKGDGLAGVDRKLADGFQILAMQLRRSTQQQHVGARDRAKGPTINPCHPRHDLAIAEPDHQLGGERHPSTLADH